MTENEEVVTFDMQALLLICPECEQPVIIFNGELQDLAVFGRTEYEGEVVTTVTPHRADCERKGVGLIPPETS